jgi:serine protease
LLITISVTGITVSKYGPVTGRVIAKEKKEFISGQFIIGYNDDVDMEEPSKKVKDKFKLKQLEKGYRGNFEVVEFSSDKQMEDLIEDVKKEKGVKYAEPNYLAYPDYDPNDPYFLTDQWNFYKVGRLFNGLASGSVEAPSNYGIQTELAWDLFKPTNTATGAVYPGEGVKVAILDTGVAYEDYKIYQKIKGKQVLVKEFKKAPDLVGTIFDTANAKNFYAYPNTTHANDDYMHGTHVCGTIAQATDSTSPLGCSGIAYKATILPIKVGVATGIPFSCIANGLNWAVDKGAKVINMSFGGSATNSTMYTAIQYAYNKGCILVASAGNNNSTVLYPAAYSECIAVGATEFTGARCSFSNYGPEIDIVAPGRYVLQQTIKTNTPTEFVYVYGAGTSVAAPHVSGTAALVWSLHPTWTRDQVRTALLSTARDLGTVGFDYYFGNGLLDANAAVNYNP